MSSGLTQYVSRDLMFSMAALGLSGWVAIFYGPISASGQTAETVRRSAQTAPQNGDLEAIRTTASYFETAYRAKDADAIAKQYAPDAEIVDIEGNVVRGQNAIAESYRKIFEEQPEGRMSIAISSIRLVPPGVAVEYGTTQVIPAPNQPAVHGRYAAVHVKQDGRWLVASTRDLVPSTEVIPVSERLKPLEFLIGEWVDESEEAVIAGSYRWGEGRNCLTHEFIVKRAGSPVLQGTQRIGWDPLRHAIVSWTFDSRGGYGQGVWTWDRNHWLIKMQGVSAAGQASSATAFLTPLGHDAYRWESTNRVLGGEVAPDTTVTIVRKPPEPHNAQSEVKTPLKP